MPTIALLWSIGVWLRRYGVAAALILGLGGSLVAANLVGTAPTTQQPPIGYIVEGDTVALQWNKGTRAAPIRLQVSVDDPGFGSPLVDKEISGTSHTLNKLEAGATYYWRLVQDGAPTAAASFEVSRYNVRF